jgi:hypothetical protein
MYNPIQKYQKPVSKYVSDHNHYRIERFNHEFLESKDLVIVNNVSEFDNFISVQQLPFMVILCSQKDLKQVKQVATNLQLINKNIKIVIGADGIQDIKKSFIKTIKPLKKGPIVCIMLRGKIIEVLRADFSFQNLKLLTRSNNHMDVRLFVGDYSNV